MKTVVFDATVLGGLSDRLGDATVAKLVALFRQNVTARCEQARAAYHAADARGLEVAFHSIKGSAQLVGARELEKRASTWEARARAGTIESIDEPLTELAAAYDAVVEKLDGRA